MTLPTSGPINVNEIHVEAGGTSGTAASMNDADIRGLIDKASGAAQNIAEYYGASSILDTQTVTVELFDTKDVSGAGYFSGVAGAISDGTSNIYSGATIIELYWDSQVTAVYFTLSGTHANSGWDRIIIDGTTYNRTDATFLQQGGDTYFSWSETVNPFGTTGDKTVTWE